MDKHSETRKFPNSGEKGIEDQKHCEEKQSAGIPNADKKLQDFANLQMDESFMHGTSGKIQKISRKSQSDDLDSNKKSRSDVQYSPYTVIKMESERTSDKSKLQDLAPSVPITDAERSVVGSTKSKGGIEESPERQISEREMSDRCTEPISDDSRKNRKRKSDPITEETPDDLEESGTSEKASDIKVGSSGYKRRKSEEHETQKTGENVSELEETKSPLKIIFTPVRAKDGSLDYSIKKSTLMDETSARKITRRRTEAPYQTIGSKISSTIDEELGKSPDPDPAKPSTSGENLVLRNKQSRVLAKNKLAIRRLDIFKFLKFSENEDQIFDEKRLKRTMGVMTSEIEKKVKTFFKQHLTNTRNIRHLVSNARKLEASLLKINDTLWNIPNLNLQDDDDDTDPKTLLELLMYLKRSPIQRAIMGEAFDLSRIDEVQLMKKYSAYVKRWVIGVNHFETCKDYVYKKIEALQTILNEAVESCNEGKKFINRLDKSQLLRDIAVLSRSLQIGEDVTRPSHVSYFVSDSYLDKVKDAYLNPFPCTDELHALHTKKGATRSYTYTSPNPISPKSPEIAIESYARDSGVIETESVSESRDCQPLSSFGYSPKDFEKVEKAIREFLQEDSSDENKMDNFQGKELSGLGLDPNTSKNPPGQLPISSSDVQQSSTNSSNQLTQTIGSSAVQETTTDSTSQPQMIPSVSTSGIERSSDTEYQYFQPTSVIVCNRNIQRSSTDTGSALFKLLTDSNDGKRQTTGDTNSQLNQPLGITVKQCLTDPKKITPLEEKIKLSSNPDTLIQRSQTCQEHEECASDSKDQNESEAEISSDTDYSQTITHFEERLKMSCNPDTLVQKSPELREHEACASDSKDQSKYIDKILSDTDNRDSLDLSPSAEDQIIELNEHETVVDLVSSPIKISEVLSDPPRNQITSTPIKRADGREHNRELIEDSPSDSYSPSEIESPETLSVGSSCDSEFAVCNKSMEIDEMNDQLSLLLYEMEVLGKKLSKIVNETQDAINKFVDSKEKINLSLMQFLRTKLSDILKDDE